MRCIFWSSLGASVVLAAAGAFGAAGDPDLSFGTGGATITAVGERSEAYALVRQADGRLVVGGQAEEPPPATLVAHFLLIRYLPDGTLDPTFGTGGIVQTDAIPGQSTRVKALLLQPDGKLVAVGFGSLFNHWDDGGDIVLARYESDGSLDTGFGTGGIVVTDVDGYGDQGTTAILQPDGRILVAGFASSSTGGASQDALIARYDTTGTLDPTFGTGGTTTIDFAGRRDRFWDAIRQADGGVVLVGSAIDPATFSGASVGVLARVDADGSPDGAFGAGGTTELDLGFRTHLSRAVQLADGKLFVAGSASPDGISGYAFFARFGASGGLDLSFGGGDGIAEPVTSAYALEPGPNDTVLAGGPGYLWGHWGALGLSRYDGNGQTDTAFGHGGRAAIYPGPGIWNSGSLALVAEPDGSTITVAGFAADGPYVSGVGEPRKVVIARFQASPPSCSGDGDCDACEHCVAGGCVNGPRATCERPATVPGASLLYASEVTKTPRILWKWNHIAGPPGFDPMTQAIGLCMWWGDLPIYESTVPPGTGWLIGHNTVGFRDRHGVNFGIQKLKIGRSGIRLVAKGENIRNNPNGFPDALLTPGDNSIPLHVQLNAQSGKCYAATYPQTSLPGTYVGHVRRGIGY